ncbi:MAG: hypothetical protein K2P99_07645 [Burkholderiales bacterium]|nr:hypothetical protein [Burkholderiales bacterium]
MCDKSNQPMFKSNELLTEDNHHLFKVFDFNDTELRYTAFNERKVRKVVAHNSESLKFWIINKLIPEISLRKDYRIKYLETQLQKFNTLAIGDVVYWSEGYNCTLYQFGKVIKKTAKTITYQCYDYRGMDCILPLEKLQLTDTVFTLTAKCAYTDKYDPKRNYDNNSD